MKDRTLVVGIGSPHGDDRLGWEIASRVEALLGAAADVRQARAPAQMLDWLSGVDRLVICDAVLADRETAGTIYCWDWPAAAIEQATFTNSHNLSLPQVLRIAEALGQLPGQVSIWGVAVRPGIPFGPLSAAASSAADDVAGRIRATLAEQDAATQ